jgi:hypothetical protein
MPQTKARNSGQGKQNKGRTGSRSGKSRSTARGSSNGSSASAGKRVKSSAGTAAGTARRSGQAVAKTASRAKVPLIAGGAAVAGLAGGVALAQNGKSRKGLRLPALGGRTSMADALMSAAKEIGKAGYKAGELSTEVRKVREQVD